MTYCEHYGSEGVQYNGWCESCAVCHACEEDVSKVPPSVSTENLIGRTQKARGLEILNQMTSKAVQIYRLIRTEADAKEAALWMSFPKFARPCPTRPRHGFVESRLVNNEAELLQVLNETLAADPAGEVMLLQFIPATYNAIWTPHLLTVGEGHDGATAGRNVVTIPVIPPKRDWSPFYKAAGIGPGEHPYVEAVHTGSRLWLTQLRAGVALEVGCSLDYIPRSLKVGCLIKTASEDMLAWEELCIQLKDRDDVIVWHPGGSLADHFSVHCRERGIPIAITFEPVVGELIVPVSSREGDMIDIPGVTRYVEVAASPRPDPLAVLEGVYVGEQMRLSADVAKKAVGMILMGLHFSPLLGGQYGRWIGIAAALMCRLGSIACKGEARHAEGANRTGLSRGEVWGTIWNRSLTYHKSGLSRLANLFRYAQFRGQAYGGKNWAMCAYALEPIFVSIARLAKEKSDDAVSDMILALNVAVNQAHNGGWWLNKFNENTSIMDTIQQGDFLEILHHMGLIYELGQRAEVPAEIVSKWARWRTPIIRPMPLEKVALFSVPGIPAVELIMTSRMSGAKERRLTIPHEKFKTPPLPEDDLYLVSSPSGWTMQAKRDNNNLVLWEEDPFKAVARKIVSGVAVS